MKKKNKWKHVAFVLEDGFIRGYINGKRADLTIDMWIKWNGKLHVKGLYKGEKA